MTEADITITADAYAQDQLPVLFKNNTYKKVTESKDYWFVTYSNRRAEQQVFRDGGFVVVIDKSTRKPENTMIFQ
jgi:hypothetical protein